MQRAIVFLALVACASAQIFQQTYDYRANLQYVPAANFAGNLDGAIPFSGALAYLPTPEFQQAIRASSSYTQTIRPANGWILAIDARYGQAGATAQTTTVDTFYLIVAATSDNSTYREGDTIIIQAGANPATACFGNNFALSLNDPTPAGTSFGAVACLIPETTVVARLTFQANNRNEAPALGFQNFQFIRRDRTIFGPTVFSSPIAVATA